MLCSNQQAAAQLWPFLAERPPVIVDWLPWSHTFGGSFTFNMILRNGGTLYIDGGKPLPGLIETTVRNLREVPSTLYVNVPRGYDVLLPYLERDGELRETFFRDLDGLFYGAASLPQHLWEQLERLATAATLHGESAGGGGDGDRSGVVEERHETEIHVQLLVAVE
jgi:feruloyl-CoA synthase